jgi:hypothetical protein
MPKMGGNTRQTTTRPNTSQSIKQTPKVGPGAPLPAIPTGKNAFTAFIYNFVSLFSIIYIYTYLLIYMYITLYNDT